MSGISLLEFIGAIATLMFVHEFGHFLAAKLFKIEVEEFGFGFPPRLLTMFKAGGTTFTLNALPFGAFVRLKSENDPSIPGSLAATRPILRIVFFLAGPIANIIVAVLLYTAIFTWLGAPDVDRSNVVVINAIAQGSPAEQVGLKVGDIILKVNDQLIDSTEKLTSLVLEHKGEQITLEYQREASVSEVKVTPRKDPPPNEGSLGVIIGNPTKPLSLWVAFPEAVITTARHGGALLAMVSDALRGIVPANQGRLVGLKGMYDMYAEIRQDSDQTGYPQQVNVAAFFTSITISLGILNLLPIPALDGGRILLALPELILRRRFPPKYETILVTVSFVLVLVLLLVINVRDFIDPVLIPK